MAMAEEDYRRRVAAAAARIARGDAERTAGADDRARAIAGEVELRGRGGARQVAAELGVSEAAVSQAVRRARDLTGPNFGLPGAARQQPVAALAAVTPPEGSASGRQRQPPAWTSAVSPRDLAAVSVVTIEDIAGRCGVPASAAGAWRDRAGFPEPLVTAPAGLWWWPDVVGWLARNADGLAGDIPRLSARLPAPPPGRRGRKPEMWVRTEFDAHLIAYLYGQVDRLGRRRYTLTQVAASLLHPLPAATVSAYLARSGMPRRGPGGDRRSLPDDRVAEMRAMRTETSPDGKPRYSLQQLADMFGISNMTASLYCRDIQVRARPGGLQMARGHTLADGRTLAPDEVARVRVMHAERTPGGQRRHTREEVAAAFGITPTDVTAIYRSVPSRARPATGTADAGPPGSPRHLDALSFPDPPVSAPRPRGTARQQSRSSTPGRAPPSPPGRSAL